jgi:hypothetical protein
MASVRGSSAIAWQVSLNRFATVLICPVRSIGLALRAKSGNSFSRWAAVVALNSVNGMPQWLLWSASSAPAPPDELSTEMPPLASPLARGFARNASTSTADSISTRLSTEITPACSSTSVYTECDDAILPVCDAVACWPTAERPAFRTTICTPRRRAFSAMPSMR